MRSYSTSISLSKNDRGIYSIDPTMGCHSGTKESKNGCYNDCYAARNARIYGYDFTKTVVRDFDSISHLYQIKRAIRKIPLPFVRMGTNGDPSENWEHTVNICERIQYDNQLRLFPEKEKEIVIITKHWENLTENQLQRIGKLKVCVNTSISVLDKEGLITNSIIQYERLKNYCKSVLRVVSCDFNSENEQGALLAEKQRHIFNKYPVLDTVFRVWKHNELVKDNIINITKTKFLGKNCHISKFNRKTYFGKCSSCLEMCGVNIK